MKSLTHARRKAKPESYRTSAIKRKRRTKADRESIENHIRDALDEDSPMTCRQLFYRLVSKGVIDKTEQEYRNTVVRLLVKMRLDGDIPFDDIADNTRWVRRPRTFDSLTDLLNDAQATYRRDLWRSQPAYVEIWCEKDALAGVLYEETAPWGVPLMVCRGYPSITYLQSCAMALRDAEKPCFLYYFGDHDPSGVDIQSNVERRLREFAPDADITFTKIGVTTEQIKAWKLPTRPTKQTDTRSKDFRGRSVDVDAIPPKQLRELCRDAIEQHVDHDALERTRRVEKHERESIAEIAAKFEEGEA